MLQVLVSSLLCRYHSSEAHLDGCQPVPLFLPNILKKGLDLEKLDLIKKRITSIDNIKATIQYVKRNFEDYKNCLFDLQQRCVTIQTEVEEKNKEMLVFYEIQKIDDQLLFPEFLVNATVTLEKIIAKIPQGNLVEESMVNLTPNQLNFQHHNLSLGPLLKSNLCSLCKYKPSLPHCLDCKKSFCNDCFKRAHGKNPSFVDHSIVELSGERSMCCRHHKQEVQMLCHDCETLVCPQCGPNHPKHRISCCADSKEIQDFMAQMNRSNIDRVKKLEQIYQDNVQFIQDCLKTLNLLLENVIKEADECSTLLKAKEALIARLKTIREKLDMVLCFDLSNSNCEYLGFIKFEQFALTGLKGMILDKIKEYEFDIGRNGLKVMLKLKREIQEHQSTLSCFWFESFHSLI